MKSLPNILITGTPGTGKSTLCQQLEEEGLGLEWVDVGKVAREMDCIESYDHVYKCPVLHEDRLLDELEDKMDQGGKVVDYHGCDFFPERWFDAVFVLRTDNTNLYDRLVRRGYSGKKLQDNVQCEIFQMILEEARKSYREEIVFELRSDTPEEMEQNVQRIKAWVTNWQPASNE